MLYINIGIVITLIFLMITDYKKHLIYDRYLILLLVFAAFRNYMLYEAIVPIVTRGITAVLLLLLSLLIGYGYSRFKKGTDKTGMEIAGGGDYKLVAAFAFLFEWKLLLLCLILEFLYEWVYRYVVHPEQSRAALPFGTSFGACGAVIIIGGFL